MPEVRGRMVDDQTRCVHFHTSRDIVAIRFFCCGIYYPCHLCHAETAGHEAELWPHSRWDEPAVLCGVCRTELSVARYLDVSGCPGCGAPFNAGCTLHAHFYFDGGPCDVDGTLPA